jgi:hypothetical protein
MLVAFPDRVAVIVPAEKFPLESRATIVEAVFRLVASLVIVTPVEPLYEDPPAARCVPNVNVPRLLPSATPEIVLLARAALGTLALVKFAPLIEGAFEQPTMPPLVVVATPAVEQPERVRPESVCVAVQVFACPSAREATTAPVVGEMVNVPSEFETEFTAPDPLPQAPPVVLN